MLCHVSVFNESKLYEGHADKHHLLAENEIHHILPAFVYADNDL